MKILNEIFLMPEEAAIQRCLERTLFRNTYCKPTFLQLWRNDKYQLCISLNIIQIYMLYKYIYIYIYTYIIYIYIYIYLYYIYIYIYLYYIYIDVYIFMIYIWHSSKSNVFHIMDFYIITWKSLFQIHLWLGCWSSAID